MAQRDMTNHISHIPILDTTLISIKLFHLTRDLLVIVGRLSHEVYTYLYMIMIIIKFLNQLYIPPNTIIEMFWIGQNTNPTLIHSLNLHRMKAPCLKEHANFSAPHHIQARPRVRITPHMSSNCSLITRHKTRRQLSSTCTYMRVTLLHPQDMINFSLQFLHTLSQFHY